jgi:hypothetical protein
MDNSRVTKKIDLEKMNEVEDWLFNNVGIGGHRYSPTPDTEHWLGADDWMCIPEPIINDENEVVDTQYVFVFRREADAVVFSLKW